jgi:uncharacterized protein (TIGR02266 family)
MSQAILLADDDEDVQTRRFVRVPDKIDVLVVERNEAQARDERTPRLEISLMVTLESDSNFYVGFAENLSDGGVFVATHAQRPIGTTVALVIALPNQPPIRAKGTVAWQREYAEENEAAPGMGIRFDEIARADVDRILEFARARQPMFFDGEILVADRVALP